MHHNIQGINSKLLELNQWFEASVDTSTVYCFSETCLKPHSPNPTAPGFTIFTPPLLCHPGKTSCYMPGSCMVLPNSDCIETSYMQHTGEILSVVKHCLLLY